MYILNSAYKWYHSGFVFVWFISLSIIPSKFIHVAANSKISLFFMTDYSIVSIYHIFFNGYQWESGERRFRGYNGSGSCKLLGVREAQWYIIQHGEYSQYFGIAANGNQVKTYKVFPFKAKFRDCEKWRSSQSTSLLSFLIYLPLQVFKLLQYPLVFNYRNRAWLTLCIKRPNYIPRKRIYIKQYMRCISFFPLIQDSLWWNNNFIIWRSECCGEGNGNPLQYSCLEKSHGQMSLVG